MSLSKLVGKPETFEEACILVAHEIAELVVAKQKDYGKNNITKFGEIGIKIRNSDKLARARNLLDKMISLSDSKALNEPLNDTWMDIAGYSILAVMLDRGWFNLEMQEEEHEC